MKSYRFKAITPGKRQKVLMNTCFFDSIQWTGKNLEEVKEFSMGRMWRKYSEPICDIVSHEKTLYANTDSLQKNKQALPRLAKQNEWLLMDEIDHEISTSRTDIFLRDFQAIEYENDSIKLAHWWEGIENFKTKKIQRGQRQKVKMVWERDAIQWTGDNLDEIKEFVIGCYCDDGEIIDITTRDNILYACPSNVERKAYVYFAEPTDWLSEKDLKITIYTDKEFLEKFQAVIVED